MNNNFDYAKLLEDIEDQIMNDGYVKPETAWIIRSLLKTIVDQDSASHYKPGDILTDEYGTVTLLRYEASYAMWIGFSVFKNDIVVLPFSVMGNYHKVGRMSPIKITIHNEDEK